MEVQSAPVPRDAEVVPRWAVGVEYLGYEDGWYCIRATRGPAVSLSRVAPPPGAKSPEDVVLYVMDSVMRAVAGVQGLPKP
jgi:hypothetical protein